jgi:hypothetical protein
MSNLPKIVEQFLNTFLLETLKATGIYMLASSRSGTISIKHHKKWADQRSFLGWNLQRLRNLLPCDHLQEPLLRHVGVRSQKPNRAEGNSVTLTI